MHQSKMQHRQFRIGELAKQLSVEKFVIRFWEKEFDLEAIRSRGGQRYYTQKELEHFALIKNLLYNQGFTIAGAKRYLEHNTSTSRSHGGATRITADGSSDSVIDSLVQLKEQLLRLQEKIDNIRSLCTCAHKDTILKI
ncbi:MerR family transcriptional regulator [Vermiphilus pyriformis]|jgi:DNA-binding transcriptional MerR regulator|nr:MAG: MerR family transcriptional regulator [Vermiphilus pyriformis]